jgi:hypothetical protein
MHYQSILAAVAMGMATTTVAGPVAPGPTPVPKFVPVDLPPPLNWIAGSPALFPRRMISTYSANLTDYSAKTFAQYVFLECTRAYPGECTSSLTYQCKSASLLRYL